MTKIDDKTPEALAPSPNSLLQFGLANAEVRLSMAKRAQLSDPVQLLLAKVSDQQVNLLLAARLDISSETASELLHQGDCAVQQVLADTEDRRAKELKGDARAAEPAHRWEDRETRKGPRPTQGPHPRTVGEVTVVIPMGAYLASQPETQPTQREGDGENLLKGYRISGASDFYGMTSEEVTAFLMGMLDHERKLRALKP
jgi:hypothetical protein